MKYVVVTPLMRDGTRIEPGEPVDMPPKEARDLLACGAVAVFAAPAAESKDAKKGK